MKLLSWKKKNSNKSWILTGLELTATPVNPQHTQATCLWRVPFSFCACAVQ